MENLEKLEKIIGKFPARNWEFYCRKLGWKKSTFYDYASTLQNQSKIYSKNGLWYPQKIEPSQIKGKNREKQLAESRVFKPEALPIVESIYKRYGYKWLEPLIEHDKEISRKLNELGKQN
ncbi:MAG: hypothetical protein N3F10_07255 [Candidatus Bathyarchaeota archaeon]|nr:hypothetical protein [Candidatus Bathyarchaeota archaeon]